MAPVQYANCSGTRNLHDNLSDLRAQVAANQKVCTCCSSSVYFAVMNTFIRQETIERLKQRLKTKRRIINENKI